MLVLIVVLMFVPEHRRFIMYLAFYNTNCSAALKLFFIYSILQAHCHSIAFNTTVLQHCLSLSHNELRIDSYYVFGH